MRTNLTTNQSLVLIFRVELYVQGSVLCTAEYDVSTQDSSARRSQYDGVRSDDLAMVPVPPVGAQSVTIHRAAHHAHGGINDFTKENDFQALLPEYDDLDLNDPRNDYLLYLKSKRSASGDRLLFRLTGADYATPFHEMMAGHLRTMCTSKNAPASSYCVYAISSRTFSKNLSHYQS